MNENVLSLLLTACGKHPNKVAMIDERRSATYSDVLREAASLADHLRSLGLRPGEPVALLVDRSIEAVTAMQAVLLCGGIYAPLDPHAPALRIKGMLACLGARFLVTDSRQHLDIDFVPSEVDVVDMAISVPAAGSAEARTEIEARFVASLKDVTSTTPCYVIFTSGSTGEPKGVTIAHASVLNYIGWARDFSQLDHTAKLAAQAPFHFDNSVLDIYLSFATGATLDIFPAHVFGFPRRLVEWLKSREITFLFWVPSALSAVAASGGLAEAGLSQLRHVVFAGEVMPPASLTAWMKALPTARFSNLYGPTEITVDCTWYDVPEDYQGERVPIGFPCKNTEILVVDEDGNDCPDGHVGEILVRGAGVSLGYWNMPELTAAAFVQNPRHNRFVDRVYRTGDLGFRDNSACHHFVGRRDGQIKRRGFRIELGDIEFALAGFNALGRAAVAFDADRDRLIVFAEDAGSITIQNLRTYLKDRLPQYMLPDELRPVTSLPTNPNGKIDKKALIASTETHHDD